LSRDEVDVVGREEFFRMMKLGFSSPACPEWSIETIVNKASAMGYNGVELHGLQGEWHLPCLPTLAGRPDEVRQMFQANKLELVCLTTNATLSSCWRGEVSRQRAVIAEFVELAARLDCPYVCVGIGEVERLDNARLALSRIAEALTSLVPMAIAHRVTLLVENGGAFPGSQELWFLVDAVGHPVVQCCWNQCNAMKIREQATVSIPRLANKIGLVHLCDADYDDRGVLLGHKPLGEGNVGIARQIELLKGTMYDGYLMFDRPKALVGSLPGPETVLQDAVKYLRERVEAKQPVLSAYKGDKYAPKMAARNATCAAR
jgi:fatty-acyl-CoA synthase